MNAADNASSFDRSTQCPICQGADVERFSATAADVPETRISVVACRKCEIAWQWPVSHGPTQSQEHFEELYAGASGYFEPNATALRCALQLDIIGRFGNPGRLLDVGAGSGTFARAAAERGWDATGIDPAGVPFDAGRARLLRGTYDDLPEPATFDAVTLLDVVEHCPDYLAVLRAAHRHLRPGGLLIVETGNYQSLNRLRAGGDWWCFQIDHRWYIAPGVLMAQLAELGFERISLIDQVPRPDIKGGDHPLRLRDVLPGAAKRPWLAREKLRRVGAERALAARWPRWHHLPIFMVAAFRPL